MAARQASRRVIAKPARCRDERRFESVPGGLSHVPLARFPAEGVSGLRQRQPEDFDLLGVVRAQAKRSGHGQVIVSSERPGRPRGHRVIAHDGRGDGVGADRVAACQQQTRLLQGKVRDPRTFASRDRLDSVDDRQVDGSDPEQSPPCDEGRGTTAAAANSASISWGRPSAGRCSPVWNTAMRAEVLRSFVLVL